MSLSLPWRAVILSSLAKKTLMALSGGGLSLFLLVHLVGMLHLLEGRASFLDHAARLHSLGPLLLLLEWGLAALILLHVGVGLSLFRDSLVARPTPYQVNKRRGASSWGSRTMPYSGLVILLFLALHLVAFRAGGPETTMADLLRRLLSRPGPALFTIVAMLALILHVSHGLWSLFQTLGLNAPRYDPLLRRGAVLLALFGGGIFILIPLLALFSNDFLL